MHQTQLIAIKSEMRLSPSAGLLLSLLALTTPAIAHHEIGSDHSGTLLSMEMEPSASKGLVEIKSIWPADPVDHSIRLNQASSVLYWSLENGCTGMVSISEAADRLFRNLDCVVARLIIDNEHVPLRARLVRHQHVSQATLNVVCLTIRNN